MQLETAETGAEVDSLPTEADGMPADVAEHGRGLALIPLIVNNLTYRRDGSTNISGTSADLGAMRSRPAAHRWPTEAIHTPFQSPSRSSHITVPVCKPQG
jgi:hypothetical protein